MKKTVILSILLLSYWFSGFSQKSCTIEYYNLVQTNETELRFDVRIKNTTANPTTTGAFAINSLNLAVDFNNAILNGGKFSGNGWYIYGLNSELGVLISDIYWSFTVNTNQDQIQYISNPIPINQTVTVLNHANWLKIGSIILKLRDKVDVLDEIIPSVAHNFASCTPNFVPPVGNLNAVTSCPYNTSTKKKTSYVVTAVTVTLINNMSNKALYSHCYSGTGNYSDTANWNIYVDPTDASFNTLPLISNNVSIGSLNNYDDNNWVDVGPVPGNCTLNTFPFITINDLSIQTTSTLCMNPNSQLTVNGSLYKENPSDTAFYLKSAAWGTASLIHNTAGINATIERYIPEWTAYAGWHLVSSPVTNQAIAPNFITTPDYNYDFYKCSPHIEYYPAGTMFTYWLSYKSLQFNESSFAVGKGYLVSYFSAGIHKFTGIMNTNDVYPAVNYSSIPSYGYLVWNLIGNPYPCAIQWNPYSWTKYNINNVVYVFDGIMNIYRAFNGETGTFNGEIPAMQGFFVYANAASPHIAIPASAKVHSSNNFYKTTLDNQLKLNVLSPDSGSNQTIIYFKNENSNDVDAFDALLMPAANSLNTQIYSYINNDKYCINALAAFTAPISVNLGFEPRVNGIFTLTADEIQSFASTSSIILLDLKTNTMQDLRIHPVYSFAADTGDAIIMRFKVLFNPASSNSINEANALRCSIYSIENKIYINTTEKILSVSVYNMLGQEVQKVYEAGSNTLSINPAGYYIVKVITNSNTYSQKVYIK